MQNEWKEIASLYKKEIHALWGEIDRAHNEFSKRMPQSYVRGLKMLENSLDFSKEHVRMLLYQEPLEKIEKKENNERDRRDREIRKETGRETRERKEKHEEGNFKWLYNKE